MTSVIFRVKCANNTLPIEEDFSDYFASSVTADDDTIMWDISLVSSACPPIFSFHPIDVKLLLQK